MTALPDACQPKPVERAAAVVEARQADFAEAEAAVRSARVGIDSARSEDKLAYARARDANRPDPGPKHVEAARAELENCERRRDGEALRLEQARAMLQTALAEHGQAWADALERALERADAASLRALTKLEDCERARAELRGTHEWLRRPTSAPKRGGPILSPLKRNLSGDRFTLADLLEAARGAIEHSTVAAERERVAEREAAEREAEQRRLQRRALTEAAQVR